MLAAGGYITPDFRAELEAGYRELKEKTESLTYLGTTYTVNSNAKDKALSGMANMYYDLPTGSELMPYIGAGIGWAHQTSNGSANAFAYQGMAGLNYKLSSDSAVFAGYRYFATTDFESKYNISGIGTVTEKASIQAHAIDVGYRYSF